MLPPQHATRCAGAGMRAARCGAAWHCAAARVAAVAATAAAAYGLGADPPPAGRGRVGLGGRAAHAEAGRHSPLNSVSVAPSPYPRRTAAGRAATGSVMVEAAGRTQVFTCYFECII